LNNYVPFKIDIEKAGLDIMEEISNSLYRRAKAAFPKAARKTNHILQMVRFFMQI
jgi:hypothetical protein